MKSLSFIVIGDPKGQPRVKAGRSFGGFTSVYDPGTANGWKSLVREAAAKAIAEAGDTGTRPIFTGPVRLDLTLWFPRPKSHFTKKGIRPDAPTYHTGKPDRDNCDKAVMDALGHDALQIWKDDAQVADGTITKLYAAPGQAAGARVHILCL